MSRIAFRDQRVVNEFAVTKSDTANYTGENRLVSVRNNDGSAGDIAVLNNDGDTVVYASVPALGTIEGCFTAVKSTATTVSSVLGGQIVTSSQLKISDYTTVEFTETYELLALYEALVLHKAKFGSNYNEVILDLEDMVENALVVREKDDKIQ